MRLEKKIIALDSTIENINDDIKEIDTQIDNMKYIYKNINTDISTIKVGMPMIHDNIKKIDITTNATLDIVKTIKSIVDMASDDTKDTNITINNILDIVKEINNRILNNHTEIVYRMEANNASVGDLNTKITKLLAQINKRNTKLKTAQKKHRPHKTSAHPNNED